RSSRWSPSRSPGRSSSSVVARGRRARTTTPRSRSSPSRRRRAGDLVHGLVRSGARFARAREVELVALGVGERDPAEALTVVVPGDDARTERHEPLDLRGPLARTGREVEMQPVLARRGLVDPLERDARTRLRVEDDEVTVRPVREL